jgi:predicted transcriptional regulator
MMNVKELTEKLKFTVLAGSEGMDNEIVGGYSSDLLSDVMGHADAGLIWITLQTHKNVMAIASLKELAAVVLVNGFTPEADMLEKANEEGIPVLSTPLSAFEVNGLIYNLIKA